MKILQQVQGLFVYFSDPVKLPSYIILSQSCWPWRNKMTRVLRQKKAYLVRHPKMPQRKCPEHLIWGCMSDELSLLLAGAREKWLDSTDKSPLISLIPLPLFTLIRLLLCKRGTTADQVTKLLRWKMLHFVNGLLFPFSTWKHILYSVCACRAKECWAETQFIFLGNTQGGYLSRFNRV